MSENPFILVTRPEPEASGFCQMLVDMGVSAKPAPVLERRTQEFDAARLKTFKYIIFTSPAAVRSMPTRKRDYFGTLPKAYCVGPATTQAAKAAGFRVVKSPDGTAEDLCAHILKTHKKPKASEKFLYCHGQHTSFPMAEQLEDAGHGVENAVVYEAQKVEALSENTVNAILNGEVTHICFFSRRTAENFMDIAGKQELTQALSGIKALCISESVLGCVGVESWADGLVSETPDGFGMLSLIRAEVGL